MKIGDRGQITIPKNLREQYGLFPNMEVEMIPDSSGIFIKKKTLQTGPVQKVYGILKKNTDTDSIVEEMRGK